MIKLHKHIIYADALYQHIYIVDQTSNGFNVFKPNKGTIGKNISQSELENFIIKDIENNNSKNIPPTIPNLIKFQ